jgi:hypothetical protein
MIYDDGMGLLYINIMKRLRYLIVFVEMSCLVLPPPRVRNAGHSHSHEQLNCVAGILGHRATPKTIIQKRAEPRPNYFSITAFHILLYTERRFENLKMRNQ